MRKQLLGPRFWGKVQKRGPDECWPWKAFKHRGYGRFHYGGKEHPAHRVGWLLVHGKFPTQCVLHTCDNPSCCNPRHWFEGTNADNMRDMYSKGRHRIIRLPREKHGRSKLSVQEAALIRKLYKAGEGSPTNTVRLGERFGVSPSTIWRITNE